MYGVVDWALSDSYVWGGRLGVDGVVDWALSDPYVRGGRLGFE